jgi:hypothetical protein
VRSRRLSPDGWIPSPPFSPVADDEEQHRRGDLPRRLPKWLEWLPVSTTARQSKGPGPTAPPQSNRRPTDDPDRDAVAVHGRSITSTEHGEGRSLTGEAPPFAFVSLLRER